jgi:hypothetical protein
MDYSKFYTKSIAHLSNAFWAVPVQQFDAYQLFKGKMELDEPIKFKPNIGKKIYDLIGSGYSGINLFSNKVINILKENNISGWKTYPCEIYDWDSNIIDGYSIFSVTGRCSAIDYSKSEKIMIQPLSPKGKPVEGIRGLYFEPNSWDESDIFTPENSKFTIVTEKVKRLFENYNISNVTFKKLTEYEN